MSADTAPPAGIRRWMTADKSGNAGSVIVPGPGPNAASQPVDPEGLNVPPEDDYSLSANLVSLSGALPLDCALLRIETSTPVDDLPRFRLSFQFHGTLRESRDVDIAQQAAPDLSLADITRRENLCDDHSQLRGWLDEMTRLQLWMRELVEGGPVRLIVWDNTRFHIPWELYYLHEPKAEHRSIWLGSVLEIARWTSRLRGPDAVYDAEQRAAEGTLMLLEMLEPSAMPDGIAHLAKRLNSIVLSDAGAWLRELAREDLRFALMMVHCHGEHADDANRFKIAGLSMNELDHTPMPALTASRPIVILNACNTAKVVPVGADVQMATRSFAEIFLNKGAAAVIATAGEVDLDQTHEFMTRLFNNPPDDHRLSSLLLAWRKYHVDQITKLAWNDAELPARLRDFFHAFLYIYFGHPDSTLQISRGTAS